MHSVGLVLIAVLALSAPPARAADPNPKQPVESHEAQCRAALDRVDDLASSPAITVAVTGDVAQRLAHGLALCRAGKVDEGAVLVRRALRAIPVTD
jgi:hypothetical protein